MKRNTILLDPEKMEILRGLAVKNKLPKTNQELVELAINVTIDCINNLDEMDFNNIFNLKK
jgi:hypothetical protein